MSCCWFQVLSRYEFEHEFLRKARDESDAIWKRSRERDAQTSKDELALRTFSAQRARDDPLFRSVVGDLASADQRMREVGKAMMRKFPVPVLAANWPKLQALLTDANRAHAKSSHARTTVLTVLAEMDASSLLRNFDVLATAVDFLSDFDGAVREAALKVLRRIDRTAASSAHERRAYTSLVELLKKQLARTDVRKVVKATVLSALTACAPEALTENAAATVIEQLGDERYLNRATALQALRTLTESGEPLNSLAQDALKGQVDTMKQYLEQTGEQKLTALQALRCFEPSVLAPIVADVIGVLMDDDDDVRSAALEALRKDAFMQLLKSDDKDDAARAADAAKLADHAAKMAGYLKASARAPSPKLPP